MIQSKVTETKGLGDRLKVVRKTLSSLPVTEYCNAIGVSSGTLSNHENDKSAPDAAVLNSIRHLTGVNLDWLITGQGDMVPEPGAGVPADATLIPSYDVSVAAGAGSALQVEQPDGVISLSRSVLAGLGGDASDLAALICKGDSMFPTIDDGDLIIVRRSVTIADVVVGGVFVFADPLGVRVKRFGAETGGRIRISSDNRAYREEVVDIETFDRDITIIGQVVWAGGKFRNR